MSGDWSPVSSRMPITRILSAPRWTAGLKGVAWRIAPSPKYSLPILTGGNTIGTDYIYAVNSCTGEAVVDTNGDGNKAYDERRAWSGSLDIGGNLLLFTPKDGETFVTAGTQTVEEDAVIDPKKIPKVQLYRWRMPRGYE